MSGWADCMEDPLSVVMTCICDSHSAWGRCVGYPTAQESLFGHTITAITEAMTFSSLWHYFLCVWTASHGVTTNVNILSQALLVMFMSATQYCAVALHRYTPTLTYTFLPSAIVPRCVQLRTDLRSLFVSEDKKSQQFPGLTLRKYIVPGFFLFFFFCFVFVVFKNSPTLHQK